MSDERLWYLDAIFYELRVRTFYDSNGDGIGDLRGIAQKLNKACRPSLGIRHFRNTPDFSTK